MRHLLPLGLLGAALAVTTVTTAQQIPFGKSKEPALASDESDKSQAVSPEGLTEPSRTIELAAAETGLILDINVEEGNSIAKDQVLARLDDLVLKASLAVAAAQKEAVGQLKIAEAEYRLRETRFNKLNTLLGRGHATSEEVTTAQSEKEVAAAKVQQAREALRVKELEYMRTQAQVERRLIKSPVDGIVTNVFREPYEFVSYTEPVVMTVVQLDPIVAVFTFYPDEMEELSVGKSVRVNLTSNTEPAQGTVSYISPVLDAESGTVKVKVEIPNPNGKYRSGDKCSLGDAEKPRVSRRSSNRRRQ